MTDAFKPGGFSGFPSNKTTDKHPVFVRNKRRVGPNRTESFNLWVGFPFKENTHKNTRYASRTETLEAESVQLWRVPLFGGGFTRETKGKTTNLQGPNKLGPRL